ncbi:MAG: response regulator transcription factor [Eubacterium sp.]|jgi:DNA-binding response OmpR family regulator|nr:response regulator transcription factor [Eubacterium sp.]
MVKILIVEDDNAIANLIYKSLTDEGYHCRCAFDGAQGAEYIEKEKFDLVLLDIMLPKVHGYELLEYLKPTNTPVIFITAKGSLEDKIKGLKLGAEDYIVKPFQVGELLARVEVVLRRYDKGAKQIVIGNVSIDMASRQVFQNGQVIELTMKEYDLFLELVRNKNIALYREQLYEKVWNEPFTGETRTLDSHIQRIRRKLHWDDKIKTVFRIGYRLED